MIKRHVHSLSDIWPNLPQTLADRMAEGLDVSFGCVATRVAWGDDGVTVTCEDGRTFAADALILTVSLGVLKVMMRTWWSMLWRPAKVRELAEVKSAEAWVIFDKRSQCAVGVTPSLDKYCMVCGSKRHEGTDELLEHVMDCAGHA